MLGVTEEPRFHGLRRVLPEYFCDRFEMTRAVSAARKKIRVKRMLSRLLARSYMGSRERNYGMTVEAHG